VTVGCRNFKNSTVLSPSGIRTVKYRGMRWMGHVACMDEKRHACIKFWWETRKEIHHSEDLGIDGRILLFIFKKLYWCMWTGGIWFCVGTNCKCFHPVAVVLTPVHTIQMFSPGGSSPYTSTHNTNGHINIHKSNNTKQTIHNYKTKYIQ
jgi:hypothetical protein